MTMDDLQRQSRRCRPRTSSVYPFHPPGSQRLARIGDTDLTLLDKCLVAGSSLVIVGAFVWVPVCVAWAYQKWKTAKRRKALYAALLVAAMGIYAGVAPQRSHRVGEWLQVRKWKRRRL